MLFSFAKESRRAEIGFGVSRDLNSHRLDRHLLVRQND